MRSAPGLSRENLHLSTDSAKLRRPTEKRCELPPWARQSTGVTVTVALANKLIGWRARDCPWSRDACRAKANGHADPSIKPPATDQPSKGQAMKRAYDCLGHALAVLLIGAVLAIVSPAPSAHAAAAGCPDGWAERRTRAYYDSAGRLAAKLYMYRYGRGHFGPGDTREACFGLRMEDYYRTVATGFTRIRVCNEFRTNCQEDSATNVYFVGPILRQNYFGNDIRSTMYSSSGKAIVDHWVCLCY